MKTKLEMAHEFMLAMIKAGCSDGPDLLERAWQYADAMQAEADKRKSSEFPNVLRGACGEVVAVKVDDMEWQPDWSQAPDELVKYFALDQDGRGGWYIEKPVLHDGYWYWGDFNERIDNISYDHAPSFGYTGDWRDSLRKRPN